MLTDYIDISAAVHSRAGLGRYAASLATALHHPPLTTHYPLTLFHNGGLHAPIPPTLTSLPQRHVNLGYKPWRMAILLAHHARLGFNRLLPNARLFHSTEHLLMPLRGIPTILTVHDLIYKRFPQHHKPLNYWYLNRAMPLYCRRATAIIAVSQATKRDLVTHYGVDPAAIHVIYEAAADHFRPPTPDQISHVRRHYNLPDQFLIHLSTIEPRKNLNRLLDALKILHHDHPNLHLLLAGGKGWLYDDFFAQIEHDQLNDRVHSLGWIPDADLPAILASADLAVQPSLYEGFGLPILEHMAVGQVVAASNTSSHPEVGGDAAAYFDPTNVNEITATIHRLLTDPDEYQHRRQLGLTQAQQFSWHRAAQETRAVYEKVANDK